MAKPGARARGAGGACAERRAGWERGRGGRGAYAAPGRSRVRLIWEPLGDKLPGPPSQRGVTWHPPGCHLNGSGPSVHGTPEGPILKDHESNFVVLVSSLKRFSVPGFEWLVRRFHSWSVHVFPAAYTCL